MHQESFTELAGLIMINLSSNQISFIERNSFSTLRYLRLLQLQFNKLRRIDSFIFNGLTIIHGVNLSYNQIEIVEDMALSELREFNFLDLSNNLLKYIGKWFKNVTLNNLILSNNSIDYILRGTFDNIDGFTNLDLSANRISSFDKYALLTASKNSYLQVSF